MLRNVKVFCSLTYPIHTQKSQSVWWAFSLAAHKPEPVRNKVRSTMRHPQCVPQYKPSILPLALLAFVRVFPVSSCAKRSTSCQIGKLRNVILPFGGYGKLEFKIDKCEIAQNKDRLEALPALKSHHYCAI
jgi:hypothetical protein